MEETRLRAVIREEVALAVKTLADQMYDSDPESTGVSFEQAASYFDSFAYRGACEAADEQRAAEAENPFEETVHGAAVDASVKAFVNGEVVNVLREMRDAFHLSGASDDYRIAERLTYVADNYARAADE